MQSTFRLLHSCMRVRAILCVTSIQRLKYESPSVVLPWRRRFAATLRFSSRLLHKYGTWHYCEILHEEHRKVNKLYKNNCNTYSLLFFSVWALAGKCLPSKTKIGFISLARSMLTYFIQYWTYLRAVNVNRQWLMLKTTVQCVQSCEWKKV